MVNRFVNKIICLQILDEFLYRFRVLITDPDPKKLNPISCFCYSQYKEPTQFLYWRCKFIYCSPRWYTFCLKLFFGCKIQHYKPLSKVVSNRVSKNLQAPKRKFVTLPNIFCGCPYEKFFFRPFHSTLGYQEKKYIFCFNLKKSSYKP